jgi:hypothetical protein
MTGTVGERVRLRGPAPLTRRAMTFALRAPHWALAIAAAVAVLSLARVTPALTVDVIADRTFVTTVQDAPGSRPGQAATDVSAYVLDATDAATLEALRVAIDDLAISGPPTMSVRPVGYASGPRRPAPVVIGPAGEADAVLYARDGAVASLDVAAETATPTDGVWLPSELAQQIGAEPGDPVGFALRYPAGSPGADTARVAMTVLAGTYRTSAEGRPVDGDIAWSSVRNLPTVQPNPSLGSVVAPLAVTDVDLLIPLTVEMGERTLADWVAPWEGDVSIERGRLAAAAFTRLERRLVEPFDAIGSITFEAGLDRMQLVSDVPSLVEDADETATAVRPFLTALSVAGQVTGAGMVVAAAWLLARSRRREVDLAIQHGTTLWRLAMRAVIELAPAALVGAIGGWAATWFLVRRLGDGAAVSASGAAAAWGLVPGAAIGSLALVGAVTAQVAWGLVPAKPGLVRTVASSLRWEVVVGVFAVATGLELLSRRDQALASGSVVLFPIAATVAVSALVVRVVAAIAIDVVRRTTTRRERPPSSMPLLLAVRRATASLREASSVTVIGATGLGVMVYASSFAGSGDAAIEAKAASLGGAVSTVRIGWSGDVTGGEPGLPTDLPAGTTVVWRVAGMDGAIDDPVDLLAIDPATFLDAAVWHPSFADESPDAVLSRLTPGGERPDGSTARPIPVVVAGPDAARFPSVGVMDDGTWSLVYRVVDRLATVPGRTDANRSLVMVSAPELFRLLGPIAPVVPGERVDDRDGNFRTALWTTARGAALDEQLADLGVLDRDDAEVGGIDVAAREPLFVAFRESLPYTRVIGLLALAIGSAGAALHMARRRQPMAIEALMLRAIGVRSRASLASLIAELLVLAALAGAIGSLVAGALVRFLTPRLDPDPAALPVLVPQLSSVALVVGAVALVAAAVGAATVAHTVATRSTSEVLRVAD